MKPFTQNLGELLYCCGCRNPWLTTSYSVRLFNLEPIHANPFGSLHIQPPPLNLFAYGPGLLSISFCYLTSLQVDFHSMHQSLFQFPLCPALDFIYPNSCQCEGEVCSLFPCTSAFSDKQMDLSISLYANHHGVRQRTDNRLIPGVHPKQFLWQSERQLETFHISKILTGDFPRISYQHTFTVVFIYPELPNVAVVP